VGHLDLIVVDEQGRIDSLLSDGGEWDGIPGCTLLEEGLPPEVTVFVGMDGAAAGPYVFWLRSRTDSGRVAVSWTRFTNKNRPACGESMIFSGWSDQDWYRWDLVLGSTSEADTCGVQAGAVERAERPAEWTSSH
jgi:hypothetical protein